MDWASLVQPELIILVPFLFGVSVMLKFIPKYPNWAIPLTLWLVGMVVAALHVSISGAADFSWKHIPSGMIQGTFMALAVVGGEQTVLQLIGKKKQENL